MTSLRLCPLLLAALLATGCAVGPDFQRPESAAPADWAAWHGGSADLLGAERRAPPNAALGGWGAFGDPLLEQLQARARAQNAELRSAALRFGQSRAMRQITAAQAGPQVGASASVGRQRQSEDGAAMRPIQIIVPPAAQQPIIDAIAEPFTLYDAGFDASWELDLWGRVRRAIEAADAEQQGSAALLRQVQLSIQAEVARRYFELRGAQRQLRIAHEDLRAGADSLALVQARADGGLVTDLDPVRQRALLAELRARIPALQQQEALALAQITLLLAERPGALDAQLALPAEGPARALPDLTLGLPSELVQRRPDIAVAEARLHAATAQVGVATADLYPRVTLGLAGGLESVRASNFGDWGNRDWRVGASLSLPIFDMGRRRGTIQLRELQQQEAAVAYQQTVLQAWHEVGNALSSYTAEQQRQAQLRERERQSRDALMLAQARYRGGMTDFGVELDAQRTLLAAQREAADSDSRLALGLVAVYKALGV